MSSFEIGILIAIFVLLSRLRSLNIVFDDEPIWKMARRRSNVLDPFVGTGAVLNSADRPKLEHRPHARNRTK